MNFCPICSYKLNGVEETCPECGSSLNHFPKNVAEKPEESFELRPRFVFVYELLPSNLQSSWILVVLFIVTLLIRDYFHLSPKIVVTFFLILLLLKDIQVFLLKFRYRNIKYIISDDGIEYIDMSAKQITYFIRYDQITSVQIGRNLATKLFGYGHILVKDKDAGIYLDYVADVEKVYEYIKNHMNV